MMKDYKNQLIHALLGYAAQRNVSPDRLCDSSSIVLSELQKENCILTPEKNNSLWRNASHLAHDRYFGLHFGESMQLAALGLIGQIIATSNTVRDALSHACRMVHLITDMFQIHVRQHETPFALR